MTTAPEDSGGTAGEPMIESLGIDDLGQRLVDLGHLLIATGAHTHNEGLRESMRVADIASREDVYEDLDREIKAAIRRTLSGLNQFRDQYSETERLTVEYALNRANLTQREVAHLLGAGLSTVNRWAQHPLTYKD
jgi:hypothetical protein